MTPQRIQLSRTKGWRKPPNTVVVSRPSKWGNPFRVANDGGWVAYGWGRVWCGFDSRAEATECAIEKYRSVATRWQSFGLPNPAELTGKNLACWCPLDQPCHADVLLELANREDAA